MQEVSKVSKVSSIREAYINFNQLSEPEYRMLLMEATSENEKRFYVALHNKMLADRQKEILKEKDFVL